MAPGSRQADEIQEQLQDSQAFEAAMAAHASKAHIQSMCRISRTSCGCMPTIASRNLSRCHLQPLRDIPRAFCCWLCNATALAGVEERQRLLTCTLPLFIRSIEISNCALRNHALADVFIAGMASGKKRPMHTFSCPTSSRQYFWT